VSVSVNLPCTIKSRRSVLALADSGGPGKRVVKRLWCGVVVTDSVALVKINCIFIIDKEVSICDGFYTKCVP